MKHTLQFLLALSKTLEGRREINAMVAKAIGWQKIKKPGAPGLVVGVAPESYAEKHDSIHLEISGDGPWHEIPDYCGSLDEIVPVAREHLTRKQQRLDHLKLLDQLNCKNMECWSAESFFAFAIAEPHHHAIAFLITKQA